MINVNKKSKIKIHWKVTPYDYGKENLLSLLSKVSKKYSINKKDISIIPDFIMIDENGKKITITEDICNIQKPEFHQKLFKDYLKMLDIVDYDFEMIKNIDSEVNSKIDYNTYEQHKRYSINWIKWDNFLSYGEDNYFNFKSLEGLVLLNGEPANQSGKSTFAIDLIHFLLFGKTTKAATLDKIFNKHLPEATKVVVEGSLTIEGEEYIIKRELSRTSLEKRNSKSRTSQKVSYYKKINDVLEELDEYIEDMQEESSIKTNKVIKEAIGNETDFDMIICATNSNLDELIEKKDTERGRLLSRWIGLLPIEEKDKIARELYSSNIKPYLISRDYNIEELNQEIGMCSINIDTLEKSNIKYINENKKIDKEVEELEILKKTLLESKQTVDNDLLKLDITTLNKQIEDVKNSGKKKSFELEEINKTLEQIGDIDFSINDYNKLKDIESELTADLKVCCFNYKNCLNDIENIKTKEICPMCKRKYDGVDNSEILNELENKKDSFVNEGKELRKKLDSITKEINELNEIHEKFLLRNKKITSKAAIELNISNLRQEYKEKIDLYKEYEKNKDAIDNNNKLDLQIIKTESNIKNCRNTKETNIRLIEQNNNEIKTLTNNINENNKKIEKIKEETKLVRHWRLYLDMVGKNGISKMVLRKTLPIINSQIINLLNDVCDFNVEISITDKNEILFSLIKDGVSSDLTSGSGFERTAAALALRTVLGNISSLPKMNFLIVDEVLGRVAKENYENMKKLYDKMLSSYDFIIQISHLEEIKDWHNHIVTVTKTNNVSKINIIR